MKQYRINPNIYIKEFNDIISISQNKTYMSVGIEIQKEEVNILEKYIKGICDLKDDFIINEQENEANLMFCIEHSCIAVLEELKMLINIKEDKMHLAWSNLVNAQTIYSIVIKNYPFEIDEPNAYLKKLNDYEKILFPKIIFASVGQIIKKSICSICSEKYGQCEHFKGKLYYGQLCHRIITESTMLEASIVETPANKHCINLNRFFNGRSVDTLTLREFDSTLYKS